jgi:hypothetical protein
MDAITATTAAKTPTDPPPAHNARPTPTTKTDTAKSAKTSKPKDVGSKAKKKEEDLFNDRN